MGIIRIFMHFLMAVACCACAAPVKNLFPPGDNASIKSIYLVSHGWHTGMVLRRADIPADIWPKNVDFPYAEFLEVGWGDKQYYQTPDAHFGITVRAALWPTSSVLHIVGFSGAVTAYFPLNDIIEIKLSEPGFERLSRHIASSFSRDETAQARPLGRGLYGNSRFYLSRESYHLFNTCNVWAARALRAAGVPITPYFSITVEQLMVQAQTFGEVVRSKPATP
ncbi:MAG: DUF2459 domain-containing protein [Motiliproteus sp.]